MISLMTISTPFYVFKYTERQTKVHCIYRFECMSFSHLSWLRAEILHALFELSIHWWDKVKSLERLDQLYWTHIPVLHVFHMQQSWQYKFAVFVIEILTLVLNKPQRLCFICTLRMLPVADSYPIWTGNRRQRQKGRIVCTLSSQS